MQIDSEKRSDSLSLSATESQKAWHIAGLLLSIGRPAHLAELGSRCTLFPGSPSAVAALCSLPGSPIALMAEDLVTLSFLGLAASASYVEGSYTLACALSSPSIVARKFSEFLGKRKRVVDDELQFGPSVQRIRSNCTKAYHPTVDNMSRITGLNHLSGTASQVPCLSSDFTSCDNSNCKVKILGNIEGEVDIVIAGKDGSNLNMSEGLAAGKVYVKSGSETGIDLNLPPVEIEVLNQEIDAEEARQVSSAQCREYSTQHCVASVGTQIVPANHEVTYIRVPNNQLTLEECRKETGEFYFHERLMEGVSTLFGVSLQDIPSESKPSIKSAGCKNKTRLHAQKPKLVRSNPDSISKSPGHGKAVLNPVIKHQHEDHKSISTTQKSNWNLEHKHMKEMMGHLTSISSKDKEKSKQLPVFESYIVEDEEGSGGYGTVYRARRKDDGVLVAIKCPHAKAHKHHVENELKMLERFGGKDFVIKYEGCFKNEDSDCFVLRHVEHDRPEVLKKEIDIFQLQCYAYCLFRGLASLHTQGIVHRDVKPGNFLFSRKTNTGYIIDFNLAMDLHQKHRSLDNAKAGSGRSYHVSLSSANSIRSSKSKKNQSAKLVEAEYSEGKKGSKTTLELKNLRKAASQRKPSYHARGLNQIHSQGADGSGITSAKDMSSVTSAKRLREPLPCQGRKELISLVQESMLNPKHEGAHVPASLRKRIVASRGTVDKQFLYLTPMPLQSSGVPISRAGMMKNRGDGKYRKEGPCAGTKGFRAPEVLFRSQYQGTKADIWSAGVTLLYLMIGKTPFLGDPEQNIKDIANLRGSEDLWEVAKLHDRGASFPQELHDTRYLVPTNLRDWCLLNTKRREFFKAIPSSLFDLVDRCLTVNPRLRISAENALKHDFFAPVHDILRRQSKQRHDINSGPSQLMREKGTSSSQVPSRAGLSNIGL